MHYILNIPHYFKTTTVPDGESTQPVVFFKYIFDKLKAMPLYDATKLRKFICNDLCIPLFDEAEPTLPIYEQWTRLSYFLQMCSPICLSTIEGGHRTMQMIKFFTGADFNNKSPQRLDPAPREGYHLTSVSPNMVIREHGLAMTKYNFSFWQRFDKSDPLGWKDAGELQQLSDWFKQSLKTYCKDTNDNFLVQVLKRLDAVFDCDPDKEFTIRKYFCSHDKNYDILNARITKAYPAILDVIKTVSPAREEWEALPNGERSKYDSANPGTGAVPIFEFLHKSFVSVLAILFYLIDHY